MRGFFKILIFFSILYMQGCAPIPDRIQTDHMKQINTMNISNVVIYEGPWIYNQDLSGASGGAHTGAIHFARDSESSKFKKYLAKNDFLLDEVIKLEVIKQFNQFTNIKHSETNRSDISITIYVNYYGYVPLGIESGYQRPIIAVNMEVRDSKNKVIARIYASRIKYEFIRKFTYNELFNNPDRVKKSLKFMVEQAISDLINKLDRV